MNYGLRYEEVKDLPKRIATILAEGKTVGRFEGRMEYGPRALGNRSILASTRDPSITKILNQKLQRNDFMPFSPATLSDKASKYYINSHKVNLSAQFMTVCLRCKPAMNATSPGTVHVDKTSRPQLVTKSSNPGLYAILKHTEKLTGVPSVINTSFNIHEEPIVCSPKDAMRVFVAAQLDYLAIDGFLVSQ
jgi:carbamoyltransferase